MVLASIAYPAIDPVALHLGPISVRWYGLAYLVGFVIAGFVMRWLVRRWEIALTDDDLLTIVLAGVVGVLVGGRLGYVLLYGGAYYWQQPLAVISIWNGGMSFHGALAGILIAAVVVARTMRVPFLTLCDLGAVGTPAALFFGRLANFVNGELWGRVTTVPWGIVFPGAGPLPRHPSQLYEAVLEGLVLFVVMVWLATRRPNLARGVIFGMFIALYGTSRIFLELFRQPDVQIGAGGFIAGGVTMGQLLSVPLVVGGVALVVWSARRGLPEEGRPESP
ncbi:MAG TPA: prolipoprotein diacylglyceryl transferase [Candidatus Limnocylindrales bacterium]